MKNLIPIRYHVRRVVASAGAAFAALVILSQTATAASWNTIEPLKSRRADVERVLGPAVKNQPGENGVLHFKVMGGTVTIAFIDARFVATKKLDPDREGTVRQIVLQHDNSSDTPDSLGLTSNSNFKHDAGQGGVSKYSNLKDGIVYTFVGGRLKTTYYTPSSEQWSRAQKG
ncbi:MAG TPA: hypothetical protein VF708_17230 [Pyrinomonadaceae bacterium]|jgi:hypothetical protein